MIQEKVIWLEKQYHKLDDQMTALFSTLQTLRAEQNTARDIIKELVARVAMLEAQPKADLIETTGREAED